MMNRLSSHQKEFTIDASSFLPQHLSPVLVKKSKKRKKSISLIIKPNNTIVTLAPFHMDPQRILDFIHSKKGWIEKRLANIHKNPINCSPRNFAEGELFPYLGQHYKLKISQENQKYLCLINDSFILSKKSERDAKKLFIQWYKKQARAHVAEKIAFFSDRMRLYAKKIKINSARQRWGSCTHANTINFSWRIICLPSTIIDYIVVHELAHISQKNHSKRFWDIVSRTLSDYKKCKKWLKEESGYFHALCI